MTSYHVSNVIQATQPLALVSVEASDSEYGGSIYQKIVSVLASKHLNERDGQIVTPAIPTHSCMI